MDFKAGDRATHKTLGLGTCEALYKNLHPNQPDDVLYFKPDVQKPGNAIVMLVDAEALSPWQN